MGQGTDCVLAGHLWLKASHEVSVRLSGTAVLSKDSTGEVLTPRLTLWLLAGFISSWAFKLRASAPSRLLVWGLPYNTDLSIEPYHVAAGFPQSKHVSKNESARESAQVRSQVFLSPNLRGDIPLLLLNSVSQKVHPQSKRRDYTSVNSRRAGITGPFSGYQSQGLWRKFWQEELD